MYSTDVFLLFLLLYSHHSCLCKFYAFVLSYLNPDGHLSSQTEIDYSVVVQLFPLHFPFLILTSKDKPSTQKHDLFSSLSDQIIIILNQL